MANDPARAQRTAMPDWLKWYFSALAMAVFAGFMALASWQSALCPALLSLIIGNLAAAAYSRTPSAPDEGDGGTDD